MTQEADPQDERDHWNRCDVCGRFIAYDDFVKGAARHLLMPQSDLSEETWETLCIKHAVII